MITKRFKKIAIGCLLITAILIVLGIIFSGAIIKKLITGTIKDTTGVEATLDNDNKKLTYTDPKTGQTLDIGTNKVPDNFPKDFPIYPSSTVTSSWSANNFELTLTTKDDLNKVISYYKDNLTKEGWKIVNPDETKNFVVSKGSISGLLTIYNTDNLTSIIIIIGEANQ